MSDSRVLIVDDDTDHADSLAEMVELEGHQVVIVGTGEEAVGLSQDALSTSLSRWR